MYNQTSNNILHKNIHKCVNVFVSQVVHEKLLERRMRLRETHEKLIEDELMKMERELQEEQVRVATHKK